MVEHEPPLYSIYFWDPSVSPHKLALFSALTASNRVRSCTYVAQEGFPAGRSHQGWELDLPKGMAPILAPDPEQIDRLFESAPRDAVHIFSGLRWVPTIVTGLRAARRSGALFGIMSEPRASEGLKGFLRLLHSRLTEISIRRRTDFVLAIGRHGKDWFEATGYDPARIFPFAYFLPEPKASVRAHTAGARPTIGYLGRIEEKKGVFLFLDAVERLRPDARILIAGAGSDEPRLRQRISQSPLAVEFDGPIPMSRVDSFLSEIDVLVAPSLTTDDGWSAVVSEALMAGAAVVSTSCVGASICLDDYRGCVAAQSVPDLVADCILGIMSGSFLSAENRLRRVSWARQHLSGETGAHHLIEILDHVYAGGPRPIPFYLKSV